MGNDTSKQLFQHTNEILSIAGTGPLGILKLFRQGLIFCSKRNLLLCAAGTCILLYTYSGDSCNIPITKKQVIFITGCDTGIGYSLAQFACEKGFTVIAGFLNINSIGAKQLIEICGNNFYPIPLDITDANSIEKARVFVVRYMNENSKSVFHALVNNAGVMVFGEFEWQTERLIQQQLNINFLGTLCTTQAFIPILRKYNGRIIVVGSHCAQASLPGLSVYGATKAALHAWCDALRIELSKFNVKVIKFIPGSFVQKSNIMARLKCDKKEMELNMSDELQETYKNYFETYYEYLSMIPIPTEISKINDHFLYKHFQSALTSYQPKALYKNEPIYYSFYHLLFQFSPTKMRDYFITKFVNLPPWTSKNQII